MIRRNIGFVVSAAFVLIACGSDSGAAGPAGPKGADGTSAPSVSAVSPTTAFLSRTIDVTISGNETVWAAAAKVDFGASVTVNKLTVASPTALLANITIDKAAAIGPRDVTVTDDAGMKQVFAGAFNVKSPVAITVDPPAGLPQGGLASVHVQMLDLSTPFDAATTAVTLTVAGAPVTDVLNGQPQASDFAADFAVEADVLAKAPQTIDIELTSGADAKTAIVSPAAAAFSVVARAAKTAANPSTGTIQTPNDTALYTYAPADASLRFVQFNLLNSTDQVSATVLPKSGKFSAAIGGFTGAYGNGVTSKDPVFIVVADGQSLFGPGPTPAGYNLGVLDVLVTAANETAETMGANNDLATGAPAITALPGLVKGTLGYGTVTPDKDLDFYKVTITGSSVGTPKTLHAASGGDGQLDSLLQIFDIDGTTKLSESKDLDYQEDLVQSITKDGDYYVVILPSTQAFDPTHKDYQLFIEIK